jgi:hypothetical protein
MDLVGVLAGYGALVWAAASPRIWWPLPAIPAFLVGLAAVVGFATYESPEPTEDVILHGFGTFLLAVFAIWLTSAVLVGWAVRLWRQGHRVWAVPFATAGGSPWLWVVSVA